MVRCKEANLIALATRVLLWNLKKIGQRRRENCRDSELDSVRSIFSTLSDSSKPRLSLLFSPASTTYGFAQESPAAWKWGCINISSHIWARVLKASFLRICLCIQPSRKATANLLSYPAACRDMSCCPLQLQTSALISAIHHPPLGPSLTTWSISDRTFCSSEDLHCDSLC